MKNWIKFILISNFLLLIIASGKVYPKFSFSMPSVAEDSVKKSSNNGFQIYSLEQSINLDDILSELNEEDNSQTDYFPNFSSENSIYNSTITAFSHDLIWKKNRIKKQRINFLRIQNFYSYS